VYFALENVGLARRYREDRGSVRNVYLLYPVCDAIGNGRFGVNLPFGVGVSGELVGREGGSFGQDGVDSRLVTQDGGVLLVEVLRTQGWFGAGVCVTP
jgi:hypothetical protein